MFEITPILESIELLDITDEEYFSAKYNDYVSNSRLSLINPDQDGSPKLYKRNDKTISFTDSLPIGSAVHAIVLQPDSYEISNVYKPSAKLGKVADDLYKILKFDNNCNPLYNDEIVKSVIINTEYYSNRNPYDVIKPVKEKCLDYFTNRYKQEQTKICNKEYIYLSSKQYQKSIASIQSLNDNKEIVNLLHPYNDFCDIEIYNEAAIFINIKVKEIETGKEIILKLKTKLDNFSINHTTKEITLNDLKTTGHLINEFQKTFVDMHYYRQMSFYLWILRLYIGSKCNCDSYKLFVNMLLVSTITHETSIFKVTSDYILDGFKEFSTLLKKVAYCEINGYG